MEVPESQTGQCGAGGLPTDKSGCFAIMTMEKYIKAGEVHVKDDKEMNTDDLKKNQRHLNGHVSMMLKFFGALFRAKTPDISFLSKVGTVQTGLCRP